jgi:Arc/MetJ family transcription regulator
MKRTNIVLDENLLKEGLSLTGLKTRRALVNFALQQLTRRKNQKKILELAGTVKWEGDLMAMRNNRG